MPKNLAGSELAVDGVSQKGIGLGIMMSCDQSSHHQSHRETDKNSDDYATRRARAEAERDERYKKELEEEANYEKERLAIYYVHVAFTAAANQMNADELIAGITALVPLKKPFYSDLESVIPLLPESNEENLFNIILCSELDDTIKLKALNHLFDRGYPRKKLFELPLIVRLFTQSKAFDPIIWDYYSSYIERYIDGSAGVPYYQKFWERFIRHNENYPEYTAKTLHKSRSVDAQIEFATLWIKSLNTTKEIEAVTKFYESMYENKKYAAYIDKMADQQLLTLALGKPAIAQEKSATSQPIKDVEITTFLASHRSACCLYLSFRTPAEKIYDKFIKDKNGEALRDLKIEQDKMPEEYRNIMG